MWSFFNVRIFLLLCFFLQNCNWNIFGGGLSVRQNKYFTVINWGRWTFFTIFRHVIHYRICWITVKIFLLTIFLPTSHFSSLNWYFIVFWLQKTSSNSLLLSFPSHASIPRRQPSLTHSFLLLPSVPIMLNNQPLANYSINPQTPNLLPLFTLSPTKYTTNLLC